MVLLSDVIQYKNCPDAIFHVDELGEDGWLHVHTNEKACRNISVAEPIGEI